MVPFIETKEQLAGYYILDCQDLDEAVEWAANFHLLPGCPRLCGGPSDSRDAFDEGAGAAELMLPALHFDDSFAIPKTK